MNVKLFEFKKIQRAEKCTFKDSRNKELQYNIYICHFLLLADLVFPFPQQL